MKMVENKVKIKGSEEGEEENQQGTRKREGGDDVALGTHVGSTLIGVVVLLSHGLHPRRADHRQMLMTFLTAEPQHRESGCC